jgi:hypothetical protein
MADDTKLPQCSEPVDTNPRTPDMFYATPSTKFDGPTPIPQINSRVPHSSSSSTFCPQHCTCCSKRSLRSRLNQSDLSDEDKAFFGNLASNIEQVSDAHHTSRVLLLQPCVVAHGSVSCGWEIHRSQTANGLPVPRQHPNLCPARDASFERPPVDTPTSTGVRLPLAR